MLLRYSLYRELFTLALISGSVVTKTDVETRDALSLASAASCFIPASILPGKND